MINSIDDIFNEVRATDLSKAICHSGGAIGSDTAWRTESIKYGTVTRDYSYQTNYHTSPNKIEISEEDYQEGIEKVNKANHILNRYGIHKYINLLARNWCQVKYSEQVFAIATIVSPGKKGIKGYYNKSKYEEVDGGTGYACKMAIEHNKEVYVFDMKRNDWYYWSSSTMSYVRCKTYPVITKPNFAGIGSRDISMEGIEAIKKVLSKTYEKFNK